MKRIQPLSLAASVTWLEDAIITLSGPLLAVSSIIAGVDVVTNNQLAESLSWIGFVWAYCLMLTLDFQVLALGVKAYRIYTSQEKTAKRKGVEIALVVVIALALACVSIQMHAIYARVNSAGVTIAIAQEQLGINPIALIYERSALVLVLIFISGLLRNGRSVSSETPVKQRETDHAISDETMHLILSKLAKLDELEQAITGQHLAVIIEPETPLALPETASAIDEIEADEPALEAQIRALLAIKPDASSREITTIVGRPHTTVYRALARVKQMKQS